MEMLEKCVILTHKEFRRIELMLDYRNPEYIQVLYLIKQMELSHETTKNVKRQKQKKLYKRISNP